MSVACKPDFVKRGLNAEMGKELGAMADPARTLELAYNRVTQQLQRSGIDARDSGTTAVSVVRKGDKLSIANVGDSRAILVRKGGKGVELTSDHRPVGSNTTGRQELDRVTRAGAWSAGGGYAGALRACVR